MTRGLIIVKAEHVEQARLLAQQPPFSATPEVAAAFLVPANPVGDEFGTVISPATHYWASGVFEDAFWEGIVQAAAALDWGGAWEYDMETDTGFPARKLAEIEGQSLFSARKR